MTTDDQKPAADPTESPRFFQKADWASFAIATSVALAIYLFTLSPEVDLEFSGIFCTAAMHLGVPNPPGYPVWTIYAWLFAKLLPFSNIAWRVALAAAVAGALTSGVIALLVSRVGLMAAESFPRFNNLFPKGQVALRIVSGCVAGLAFGLDGCFWLKAVRPDPWPLGLLLFSLTLCLLTRWFFMPQSRRDLYFAALTYGLGLGSGLSLVAAIFGLPFLVALGDRKLGRELFFGIGVFLWGALATNGCLHWYDAYYPSTRRIYLLTCIIVTLMWIILSVQTRSFLSEWKSTSLCAGLFLAGISAYLVLPIISMTDPPVNWGYPRTVEGFFHVITRGQYEQMDPTDNFARLVGQCAIYGKIAANEFGTLYLIAAAVPFCFLHKISLRTRQWLVGLWLVWVVSSLLTLVGLNPGSDKSSIEMIKSFFAASHLLLAVFTGCGLMLIGVFFGRAAIPESRS